MISRRRPNVWENGGAEQYIKPLDTVISLTVLAYVTSLRGWKPFIFMAGFIKTPMAGGGSGGGGGQKLFPITQNEALSFIPSLSMLFIESGANRCSN